jgi:predicted phosphodiesterase
MELNLRFGVVSDLHLALAHTIWDHPHRFHLVEVGQGALEVALAHFLSLDLDFLLIPGDLTQHGERENHKWLADRLAELPFPVYVVPGNHDTPYPECRSDGVRDHIAPVEFAGLYSKFGYDDPTRPYYCHELALGLRLIGLNSNCFDGAGNQIGAIDGAQWVWLDRLLDEPYEGITWVMIHHNVVEHLPRQSVHPLGRRYMVDRADRLRDRLSQAGVSVIWTGHLHVQDVVRSGALTEITTGSLVSYPHPYRICQFQANAEGSQLQVESPRVRAVAQFPDLQTFSRDWMGDRSFPFMVQLLVNEPLNWSPKKAAAYAEQLRYFWAMVADGDGQFDGLGLPEDAREFLGRFGAIDGEGLYQPIDNQVTLQWWIRLALEPPRSAIPMPLQLGYLLTPLLTVEISHPSELDVLG